MTEYTHFDYEAYIKDMEERTTNSQIPCREWRADNYTSYTVNLPDGSIIVVDKHNDNTKAIFYNFLIFLLYKQKRCHKD